MDGKKKRETVSLLAILKLVPFRKDTQDTQLQLFLFGSIVLFELHLSQELLSIIVIFRVELFSFVVVTTQFNQRVVSRGDRFLSSKAPVCMRF